MNTWIIKAESEHFSWLVVGTTEKECVEAFRAGLSQHCRETEASPEWAREMLADYKPQKISTGKCYRDGSEIKIT